MQIQIIHLKIAKRGFASQIQESKISAYCSMFICLRIGCRLEDINRAFSYCYFLKVHNVNKDSIAQRYFTGKESCRATASLQVSLPS